MYYLLDNDSSYEEKKYFELNGTLYNKAKEEVGDIFEDGIIHKEMKDPYVLILDASDSLVKNRKYSDSIVSYAIDAGSLLLISPKAQELFIKLVPDDIKMYDVTIKGSGFELSDYKIVKVLQKIDCVNIDKSEVELRENSDQIRSARTLVLDEEKIPVGKQIFLLGKRSSGVIVIHENLKNKMEEANLTGFQFFNLDEAYEIM